MNITWLGQAGLLFEKDGLSIMIDPYLSDSVEKVNPKNYRRVSIDERFFEVKPDVMIFTHDHLDHFDPKTAHRFFNHNEKPMTVLCPASVWQKARTYGGEHNYVQFQRGTQWTEDGFQFQAVKAEHSDPCAIGVVIKDLCAGKTYYITGDTLYHEEIFPELPEKTDVVFLPINGVGNNMNMIDAARFARRIGAKITVPIHFGMFDRIDPEKFTAENRIIPEIYREMDF